MATPRWSKNNNTGLSAAIFTGSSEELTNPASFIGNGWTNSRWQSTHRTIVVDSTNDKIDFTASGAAGTLVGTVAHGHYRQGTAIAAAAEAMNTAVVGAGGTGNFTGTGETPDLEDFAGYTLARASGTFVLLKASGANKAVGAWTWMGFRQAADSGSVASYTSDYVVKTSGGTFTIDATNDQVPFKVGGSPFTGTATHGTFNAKSLMAMLKAVLDAAASVTDFDFTQTEDTWKFRFRKASSNFDFLCTNTTNAIWDTLGFDTSSDKTAQTDLTADFVSIHFPSEWIVIDFGASNPLQVAMTEAILRGYNFTVNATVKVQANASNAWTSPTVDQAMTLDFGTVRRPPIMWERPTSSTLRYARILISDQHNADGRVELGLAWLGNSFTTSRPPSYDGIVDGSETTIFTSRSPSGNISGSIASQLKTHAMIVRFNTDNDRDNLEPLFDYAETIRPFFISVQDTLDTAHIALFVIRPTFPREQLPTSYWDSQITFRDGA